MDALLQKLINKDSSLHRFTQDNQIIQQGLAPLTALTTRSTTILKANLLETLRLQNWQDKAQFLFSELEKNSIRFLVFKGFAFTFLLYNKKHFRPHSDIDIIVSKSDYPAVKSILLDIGYQQYASRQGQFVSFQNSFFDQRSPQAVIDLHWQINNRVEFHKHFQFDKLYSNAIKVGATTFEFNTLGLIDSFIVGCFHYQAHRPDDRKHIWLYDLALLWKKMDTTEQSNCIKKAIQTEQSNIVTSMLLLLQETFIHVLNIGVELDQSRNEETEFYLHTREHKLNDFKTKLKNIKGLKNKTIFLGEYVFQNSTYVKQRYGVKSNLLVYMYYPRMWFEDILKLLK